MNRSISPLEDARMTCRRLQVVLNSHFFDGCPPLVNRFQQFQTELQRALVENRPEAAEAALNRYRTWLDFVVKTIDEVDTKRGRSAKK